LPRRPAGLGPLRAAGLRSADCQRGEILLGDSQRAAAARELDALKSLGAQAIVLQICYPSLTPAFRDPQPFLDYYANLANEVRSRDMKLLVEHQSLLAAYSAVDPRPYYRKLTKQRFERERFEEIKTILLAAQPDYLTLVSEPRVHNAGLKLTVKEWRSQIRRTVERLAQQLGAFSTLLGAGSSLGDDPAYVEAFARIDGLSYIDLHLYPLAVGGESSLQRLLTWPERIRSIDTRKRIVMSELWLAKVGASEAANASVDPQILARDVYRFWAALDLKFLRVAANAASVSRLELIAPSRSEYLFSYLDYSDPLTFLLRPRELLELARQRAQDAISSGRTSDTGLTFRDM